MGHEIEEAKQIGREIGRDRMVVQRAAARGADAVVLAGYVGEARALLAATPPGHTLAGALRTVAPRPGGAVAVALDSIADDIEDAARRHLCGIEGGISGAVRDLAAGKCAREAAGLGAGWDIPDALSAVGIGAEDLDAAVLSQLRAAARYCAHLGEMHALRDAAGSDK